MSEKVLCPYCGAEMELTGYFVTRQRKQGTRYRFICDMCDAYAPSSDSEKGSISAALRRYTPPLRPMTLEDVKKYVKDPNASPLWYEGSYTIADNEWVLAYTVSRRVSVEHDRWYGKTWRCWKRKPTETEMREAAWEK